MTSRTIPSIDFRVWSSQLGTIDSFTDDLLKRLENTSDTKSPTLTVISASTISLSTLDDEKTPSILSSSMYMEKTLEQSCQSFERFNIKEYHSAEERRRKSVSEKSILRKSSAYLSHTLRKMRTTEHRRPSSLVIKSEEERTVKKPMTWWRKLFSRT